MLDDHEMELFVSSRSRSGFELALSFAWLCLASACGGGGENGVSSGPECPEVCADAAKCSQPSDAASCMSECTGQRKTWNQGAWNTYTACVAEPSCKSLSDCMQKAAAAAPSGNVDHFLGDICGWAVRCAGGAITQSQCVTMLKNVGQKDAGSSSDASPWDVLRVLQSSTVDCVASCVQGLSCTQTDFGSASSSCAQKCGLGDLLGSSSSSSSSGSSNTDTMAYCVMQHGDCGGHGTMMATGNGYCSCQCDKGYVQSNYVCVPDCTTTGCNDHGSCQSNGVCECDQGYYPIPNGPDGGCSVRPYFVDLATSEQNTCGVRNDGALECWGESGTVLQMPNPNQGFTSVKLGGSIASASACALHDDSSVVCWSGIAAPGFALRSMSLGGDAACGVAPDDSLHCWGFSPFPSTSPPDSSGFKDVALGDQLACGIRLDGTLSCWGTTEIAARAPTDVSDAEQVCVNSGSGCVRRSDGSIQCFGYAEYVGEDVPAPNSGFTDVSCGDYHACALRADGGAVCWGNGALLGSGLNPPADIHDFTKLEVADEHSCGLRIDGSIACWGMSTYGEALPTRAAKIQ